MNRIICFIKDWWLSASSKQKILAVLLALASLIFLLLIAYLTARFWLPFVVCIFLLGSAINTKYRNLQTLQKEKSKTFLEDSRSETAMFIQWLFCKNNRDFLGLQVIPLACSLAYLDRNIRTKQSAYKLEHTVSVGLQQFNTHSFYLLHRDLKNALNDALCNYCSLKSLTLPDGSPRFQLLSSQILDGAVLPEIVLVVVDRNFQYQNEASHIFDNSKGLYL